MEYDAFHVFNVDAVMVELTVSATDKFIVEPEMVEISRVEPVSVEKNPLFKNIEEAVIVDVRIDDPLSVE